MRSCGCSRHYSQQGGVLFGLLVSALVIVCMVIAGALFIARNVRVQTAGRNGADYVSIDTPVGNLSIRAHEKPGSTAADVPIYPGARSTREGGGDAVFEWNSSSGRNA